MGDLALQWYWRGAADKDGVAKEVLAMSPGGFLIRSSTSTLDAYVLTVNDHGIILVRNSILSRKKKLCLRPTTQVQGVEDASSRPIARHRCIDGP